MTVKTALALIEKHAPEKDKALLRAVLEYAPSDEGKLSTAGHILQSVDANNVSRPGQFADSYWVNVILPSTSVILYGVGNGGFILGKQYDLLGGRLPNQVRILHQEMVMVVRRSSTLKVRREISIILRNMRVPMFNLRKYLTCSQTLARDDYRCLVTGKVENDVLMYKYVSLSRNTCQHRIRTSQ